MHRSVLFAMCLFLLGLSWLGLRNPASEVGAFMELSRQWMDLRLGIIAFIALYLIFDPLRQPFMHFLVGLAAGAAILFGVLSFTNLYMPVVDTFSLLGLGVYTLLFCLECPTTEARLRLPQVHLPKLSLPNMTLFRIWFSLHTHRRSVA